MVYRGTVLNRRRFLDNWRAAQRGARREKVLDDYADALTEVLTFGRVEKSCPNPACLSDATSITTWQRAQGVPLIRATGICAECGATFVMETDEMTFAGIWAVTLWDRLQTQGSIDEFEAVAGLQVEVMDEDE